MTAKDIGIMRAFLYAALMSTAFICPVYAAEEEPRVYMEADTLAYDTKNKVVVAKGNVEVMRDNKILLADKIYYYQEKDIVKAKGNIVLLQPDGNVLFADNITLKDDLKYGVVEHFRARFADNSAFAAAEARRVSAHKLVLKHAVYSPCKICEEDPEDEPLWQIKAETIRVNAKKQKISYDNATMEVLGVPVFYTPYFSHPTPDADRKSGFLPPEYQQSTNLGVGVRTPYYINIAPDKDATIAPWYTSKEGLIMLGEYRQVTDNGKFHFEGSGTLPERRDNVTGERLSGNEFRGHIFATGRSRLNEDWNWGFDINRTSDDTYLRRYRFGFFETLTSRAYTERIEDRDYAVVEGLAFQSLDGRVPSGQDPVVIPNATVHMESDRLAGGARVAFDANAMALSRDEGAQTRRLATGATYHIPYVTDNGHVFGAEAGLRVDAYHQENLLQPNGASYDGTQARAVPHAALSWRYPLMTQVNDASLTVEPIAKIVTTTTGHNSDEIANEDSLTPELTHLNLFRSNRFAGYDRIEEGTRAMAGVQGQTAFADGQVVSAMIGQEIRLDGENPFPTHTDPDRTLSDIVGQLGYDGRNLFLDYQYRVDSADMALKRNELRGQYNFGRGSLALDYVYLNDDPVLEDRNDVTAGLSFQALDWLGVSTYGRRDLLRDNMVTLGGGFIIDYDCVTLHTMINREFTSDRDFEQDTSIMVRVGLKNVN